MEKTMRHETEDRRKPQVWNIRDPHMPADALYIGRPGKGQSGKWGNPFPIDRPLTRETALKIEERMPYHYELGYAYEGARLTREQSLELYAEYLTWAVRNERLDVRELVVETEEGWVVRDTGCFCAPQPCHGDVLMKFAEAYAYYRNDEYEHERALDGALYIHRGMSA